MYKCINASVNCCLFNWANWATWAIFYAILLHYTLHTCIYTV